MIDLIKFVVRGALGGAIFPFVIAGLTLVLAPYIFVVFLGALLWCLIPGAVVGLGLWLIARFLKRLRPEVRFGVGTLVVFVTLFGLLLLSWMSASIDYESLPAYVAVVLLTAIVSAGTGGIAGLACPDSLSRKKEPKLNYWERLALSEMAEREASVACARQAQPAFAKKSRAIVMKS
jgi:hypothetical protein